MRLIVNADTLTIDDLIQIEEGGAKSIRGIRDMLARFAVADDGEAMSYEDAQKALGRYTLSELLLAVDQLRAAVVGIKERAVPPVISSS